MTSAQKTPWAIAATTRVAKANSYVGANAVATLANANTARATATITRRSNRRVARVSGMLVPITTRAHTETSMPMRSGSTPRSAAISGMSPAGSDSAVTVTNTPNESSSRDPSGKRTADDGSARDAVDVVMERG